ncbi:hypothetical protein D3C86_1385220 [compost metagenome]
MVVAPRVAGHPPQEAQDGLLGLVETPELLEGPGQVADGVDVLVVDRKGPLEEGHGPFQVLAARHDHAEHAVAGGVVRQDGEGLAHLGLGQAIVALEVLPVGLEDDLVRLLLELLALLHLLGDAGLELGARGLVEARQGHGQVVVGQGPVGLRLDGLPEGLAGLLEAALLEQDGADPLVGDGVRGVEQEGLLEGGRRPVQVAREEEHGPELHVVLHVLGIEREALALGGDGLLELALLLQGPGEREVGIRVVGIACDRLAVLLDGPGHVLLLGEDLAQEVVGLGVARLALERQAQGEGRVVELAPLQVIAAEAGELFGGRIRRRGTEGALAGHEGGAMLGCHRAMIPELARSGALAPAWRLW